MLRTGSERTDPRVGSARRRRRGWIRSGLLLLTVLVAACGKAAAPGHPNVVLLVMDTTRGDRCSVTGYDRETTPSLDRLALESTTYVDTWAPAGWTGPSHASLFTGLRPIHHGLLRGVRNYLMPETTTLAEILLRAGYRTGCFTNNGTISPMFGLTQGFEHVVGLYADENRPYPWAPATHEMALKWALKRHRNGDPFFLFVNDMEPHFPYTPPAAAARRFTRPGTSPEMIEWGEHIPQWALQRHNVGVEPLTRPQIDRISDLYDAEIYTLDDAIGALAKGLGDAGILDDTVFIVVGDHGENLGDHGLMDHLYSLHRSICHVPLLIRYPARFAAGKKEKSVVRLEDLLPTVLDAAGLPIPPDLDGSSIFSDLPGRISRGELGPPLEYLDRLKPKYPDADLDRYRHAFRSVYDGRYQLIRRDDGETELYDVGDDPLETRDLASGRPAEVERMQKLMDPFHAR